MAMECAVDTLSAFEEEMKKEEDSAEHAKIDKRLRIETRFGQCVRMHRRQRHLTQVELAQLCQINQNYISDIECGKRNVTLRVVEIIAKALGVEVDALVK